MVDVCIMLEKLKTDLLKKTKIKKIVLFLIADIFFISLSSYSGFYLRFDGHIPAEYNSTMLHFIITIATLTIFYFILGKIYLISLSFVSVKDLLRLIKAISLSFFTMGIIFFILRQFPVSRNFPRSIFFITYLLVLFFTASLRFIKRIYYHGFNNRLATKNRRVLIFGAGSAGEELIRHIMNSNESTLFPVGLIDDNPMKQGISIHGIRVLGTRAQAASIIQRNAIHEVIIAMPATSPQVIRETVNLCRQCHLNEIKILPSTQAILEGRVNLNKIRDISIEDLLGRNAVKIDTQTIKNFITGKTVLVTGSAGSIGSVLCHEILKFNPGQFIGLDNNETEIFYQEQEMNKLYLNNNNRSFIIGNICDYHKMEKIFSFYKPDVVFHAAAYKHVPMLEQHPDEAVKNNIIGTLNVGRAAIRNKTGKFVMISTDKAINPTSVMGASKRICEMLMVYLNKQNSTRFCAVRFGNVLGSRGSVIPIFQEQIKKNGPVEVTHPEMKRYFMVTSEACLLVMQAGTIGTGGEVFVLDMGEPIKICDLAKEMIKLAGYEPDVDIPIVYTGIRPGEKLFEEILTESEQPTKHEKIFISKLNDIGDDILVQCLAQFQEALKTGDSVGLKQIIKQLVPTIN